jgi:DNA-binding MarR family transcriptional regulator/ribosomal protein S18 acetylase RimI-like enzyme
MVDTTVEGRTTVRGDEVAQVRRFNRAVTQRVGALHDQYLARDRPLGEARVLWEIGPDGCDVRTLRARLDLDSGYLSRLLRSLEAAGLVAVGAGDGDRRVRRARLTAAGRAERELLDDRSEALAAGMLAPLSAAQRDRLVAAMADVERLLTASLVEVEQTDPGHRDARWCLAEYMAELDRRFDVGFDADRSLPLDRDDMVPPAGAFLVAGLRGEPVGCGGYKRQPDGAAYLKRMWVAPAARGLGLGRRLLAELEDQARAAGAPLAQLETNGTLAEAIALYRSAGYAEVEPFNDEPYAHHWFAKPL